MKMLKKTKLFTNTVKSLNEKLRQATFVISTDEKDRMGEVVEQSWQLDNYKKNPIVLFGHDPSKPSYVLGKAIDIKSDKEGDKNITLGTVQFAEEGTSEDADTVWKLVKQGILRTVSVGFIPHTFKKLSEDDDTDVLADNELLEFSIVPIPANPSAVALALGDGSITEKDARYMLKTYKNESVYLEKTLYDIIGSTKTDSNTRKDKTMSDEDVAKVAEAVGSKLNESLSQITGKLDELINKLDNSNDEEKPDEANEDKPLEGDEEDKSKANSKQVDEEGAIDENEQLGEEQEKEFLAQLDKDYAELNK